MRLSRRLRLGVFLMAAASAAGRPVRADEAASPVAATVAGAALGSAIAGAWVLRDRAARAEGDAWGPGTVTVLLAGGAAIGAGIGYVGGVLRGPPPGRAAFTPVAAVVTATSVGLAAAAFPADATKRDDVGLLSAAITMEVAAIGATWLGRALEPSPAETAWLGLGGLAGGLLAGGAAAWAGDRVAPATFVAGASGVLVGGLVAFLTARVR